MIWLRRLILLFLAVFLGLVVLLAGVIVIFDEGDYKHALSWVADRVLDSTLVIDGRLSVQYSNGLLLSIDDVKLDAHDDSYHFSSHTLKADIQLRPLLSGTLWLNDLELSQLFLKVNETNTQSFELQDLASIPVIITRANLEDLAFEYQEAPPGTLHRFSLDVLRLDDLDDSGPIHVQAHGSYEEEKIELRRETMLENIRRENDEARGIAGREFARILYGDHPMAWRATEETVSAITRDDLVAYHQAFFHPNNAIIGISGDVTKDEIMGLLDEALASWEQAEVVIEPEPELPLAFEPSVNYVFKDIDQGVIMIGHLGLNSRDENRPAVQIMNFILGGGSFTSRITQKVRTEEGLAYAAYSRYSHDAWTYGTFVASSQTRSDATARAASLIVDLIAEMQAEGPSEEEFENARDAYLNKQVFDYDSKSAVVQRLVQLKWQGRPLDTPERDIETIENLTLDDVKAAAAEYLHPDGLVMLFVGDQDKFEQPLSNFGEVNVIELPE